MKYQTLSLSLLLAACSGQRIDFFAQESATNGDSLKGGQSHSGGSTAEAGGAANGVPSGGHGADASGGMGGSEPVLPPDLSRDVLLIVDEIPTSTDDVVEQRLLALEHRVTRISELEVTDADAADFDLIVVTPSADRSDFPKSLGQVAVPLLSLEPSVSAKLGWGEMRSEAGQTEVLLAASGHAIIDSYASPLTVCSGPSLLQGSLSATAVPLMQSPNNGTALLFVYEKGELVGAEPTPARRAAYSVVKTGSCQTPQAWDVFERSISWLLGFEPPE